ncbi:MAG: hypothetical protein ACK4FG_04675 [Brevundimonas sp.]
MREILVPGGDQNLSLLDPALIASVADAVSNVVEYLGVREQLHARLEEIARDYQKLDTAEANEVRMHALQSEIVRVAIGGLIERGAHDQAVEIFKHYMDGTPSFVSRVTQVIMKRLEVSPPTIVTQP